MIDQTKLLTFAVVSLLLLNLGTLGFLVSQAKPHGSARGPQKHIVEKLKLDEAQQAAYQTLIGKHRAAIRAADKQRNDLKNDLYALLKSAEINAVRRDSLLGELTKNQAIVEQTHFAHFEDIRRLCRPEQVSDFNSLANELSKLFGKNRKSAPERE